MASATSCLTPVESLANTPLIKQHVILRLRRPLMVIWSYQMVRKAGQKRPSKKKNFRQRSLWPQDQSLGSDPDFLTRVTQRSPVYLHKVNRETCQVFFKLPVESGPGGRCSHQTWMLGWFGCVYCSLCLLSEQEGPGPLGERPAHWSGI